MSEKIDEMIKINYTGTKRKNKMSIIDRAAQFAPFAALKGHFDILDERSRFVQKKKNMSEDQKEEIRVKLNQIAAKLDKKPLLKIIYFKNDSRKDGGEYLEFIGRLENIKSYERILFMENGFSISIDDIYLLYEIEQDDSEA